MGNSNKPLSFEEFNRAFGFKLIRDKVKALWEEYHSGSITYDNLMKRLAKCRMHDNDSTVWAMGHDDHTWYQLNKIEQRWERSPLPISIDIINQVKSSNYPLEQLLKVDDRPGFVPQAAPPMTAEQISNAVRPFYLAQKRQGKVIRFFRAIVERRRRNRKGKEFYEKIIEPLEKEEKLLEEFLRRTYPK
ncbi:MAG: hypothetical protein JNJ61_26700 [Anaerolineae bacterium]|nr:hypothetical protein [Anaerolineae bacterium]